MFQRAAYRLHRYFGAISKFFETISKYFAGLAPDEVYWHERDGYISVEETPTGWRPIVWIEHPRSGQHNITAQGEVQYLRFSSPRLALDAARTIVLDYVPRNAIRVDKKLSESLMVA